MMTATTTTTTTTKTNTTATTSAAAIQDFLANASPIYFQTFRGHTEANALEFVMDLDFQVDRALWIMLPSSIAP